MPKLSITLGIILIILGMGSYIITGAASATALIPAFFGIAFGGLGMLANRSENFRKHSMHAALLLAVLGLGGSFGGLVSLIGAIGGEMPERPSAVIAQGIMAILMIGFILAGIKSFINARRIQKSS